MFMGHLPHVNYYRLAYGVWMLERIITTSKTESCFYVMYDITCTLFSHLKVTVMCVNFGLLFPKINIPNLGIWKS